MSDIDLHESDYARPGSRRHLRLAFAIAAAVLLATMCSMGGIHPKVAALFGLGSAGAMIALSASRRTVAPPVAIVFFVLAGLTLLQCVPLPIAMLRVIAPANADCWSHCLSPLSLAGPSWAPISLAPEITLIEATKWAGYGCMAAVGHAWSRAYGLTGPSLLALGLALAAGFLTLAHGALGATKVFGIYQPSTEFPRWRMGPLLNSNHLTEYLMLGLYGGLALLLAKRTALNARTAAVLAATTALVVGIVLLQSRAGVALLAVGVVTLPVVFVAPGDKRERLAVPKRALMLGISVFVGGGALAAFGYGHEVLARLAGKDFVKLQLLRDVPPMLEDHWAVGFGRGAFESAYFAYKSVPHNEYWTHPENFLVQWGTEWGVPGTVLAIGLFLWALVGANGLRVSVGGRTLLLGLFILMAENLVDFGIELPAIGGLTALMFGAICGLPGQPTRKSRRKVETPAVEARPVLGMVLGTVLAALSLAAFQRHPRLLSDLRADAMKLAPTISPEAPNAYQPFVEWMERYPAEPYIPLAGAVTASKLRPLAAMPWLNRALELGPHVGATHMALAHVLLRSHLLSQALLEARLSFEGDPDFAVGAASFTAAVARTTDELFAGVPDGPSAEAFVDAIYASLSGLSPLRSPFRDQIIARYPCKVALLDESARETISALTRHASPCESQEAANACDAQVEAEIQRIRACPDGTAFAERNEAELEWARGEKKHALELLEVACQAGANNVTGCLRLVAERSADARDDDRLRRVVRLAVARGCQSAESCSQAWSWAVGVYVRAGDSSSAYVAATKAVEMDPTNFELRRQLAEAALRAGSRERAEVALEQLLSHRPDDASARTRLAEIRAMPVISTSAPAPSATDRVKPPPRRPSARGASAP